MSAFVCEYERESKSGDYGSAFVCLHVCVIVSEGVSLRDMSTLVCKYVCGCGQEYRSGGIGCMCVCACVWEWSRKIVGYGNVSV